MAVSNTIGSNVFDILIGLALPWFIKTAIVDPGSTVTTLLNIFTVPVAFQSYNNFDLLVDILT